MHTNLNLLAFGLYLLAAVYTTMGVGNALYKNGAVFLQSIFRSKPELVAPVNKLLLVGYYLVNLGFVLLFFNQKEELMSFSALLETVSQQLGQVLVVLGIMHVFNISVFILLEKKINSHAVTNAA